MVAIVALASMLHLPAPNQRLPWRQTQAARAAEARAAEARESVGPQSIVVGTQRLYRCTLVVAGYCGHFTVPLNWLDKTEGTLVIRYQWLPARGGSSAHTIVAEEGGPGYATTGTGYEYRTLLLPLLGDHNLLMMDQRGTGGSEAIDCPALQP